MQSHHICHLKGRIYFAAQTFHAPGSQQASMQLVSPHFLEKRKRKCMKIILMAPSTGKKARCSSSSSWQVDTKSEVGPNALPAGIEDSHFFFHLTSVSISCFPDCVGVKWIFRLWQNYPNFLHRNSVHRGKSDSLGAMSFYISLGVDMIAFKCNFIYHINPEWSK